MENILDRRDLVGRAGVNTISGPFTFRLGLGLHDWEAPNTSPGARPPGSIAAGSVSR